MKNNLLKGLFLGTVLTFASFSFAGEKAVQLCTSLGGIVDDYKISGEQASLCKFGGAAIGLMTLYHGDELNRDSTQGLPLAIKTFLEHPAYHERKVMLVPVVRNGPNGPIIDFEEKPVIEDASGRVPAIVLVANPASTYCKQVGGKIARMEKENADSSRACIFNDFSAIEANTLFHGPEADENSALTQRLQDFTKAKKIP